MGSGEVEASVAKTESASTNEAAASSSASTSGSAEQTGNGHQHASTPRSVTNLSSSDNNGQRKESSGVQNGSRNGNNGSQNGTQSGTQGGSQNTVEGVGGATIGGGFEGGSTSDNGRELEYRPSAENMKGGDWMSSTLAQARLESHYSVSPAFLLFRCLRVQLLFLWLSWPCHQYILWYSNLSLAPEQGTICGSFDYLYSGLLVVICFFSANHWVRWLLAVRSPISSPAPCVKPGRFGSDLV